MGRGAAAQTRRPRGLRGRERMQPKIRRQHDMPFGAQFTAAAKVRFRLWAPAARQVDVILYHTGGRQLLAMRSLPGGWFALETAAARAGSLYRFRLDGVREVADPASRRNPHGVHRPSEVIEPTAFAWDDEGWRDPPWPTAVIYELHVGTFTAEGTFAAVAAQLEHLARLGVTALELMPVAAFRARATGATTACCRTPRRARTVRRRS